MPEILAPNQWFNDADKLCTDWGTQVVVDERGNPKFKTAEKVHLSGFKGDELVDLPLPLAKIDALGNLHLPGDEDLDAELADLADEAGDPDRTAPDERGTLAPPADPDAPPADPPADPPA